MAKPPVPTPVPTVTTDLLDYLPGSTATITASDFIIGSTLEFQVQHVTGAGKDGKYGTRDDTLDDQANATGAGHTAWYVTDGVRTAGADGKLGTADDGGDLDGKANGTIVTNWYVNPDDSAGATFLLTATNAAAGQAAATSFTDSVPADATVNLVPAASSGAANGAYLTNVTYTGAAGSGVIDSFVRVQAQGNGTTEQGYNTDFRPLQSGMDTGQSFNRSLWLNDQPGNDGILGTGDDIQGVPIAYNGGLA